jgi:hypothetical protein
VQELLVLSDQLGRAQSAELQTYARSRTEAELDRPLLTQKLGMITFSKRKKLTDRFLELALKSGYPEALDRKGLRRVARAALWPETRIMRSSPPT